MPANLMPGRIWPGAVRALPLALLAGLAALSGCTSDVSSSSEVNCADGVCEVCVDGACAPCAGAECDACVEADGDCAAMQRADAVPAQPATFPDVDVRETHDLVEGFPETTWAFDVAPGATGHVRLSIRDPVAGQATVMASACFSYTVTGPWGSSSGSESNGNCSGSNLGVSGSTATGPKVMADWDDLQPGNYVLVLQAPRQPNQLSIDIHVDNP